MAQLPHNKFVFCVPFREQQQDNNDLPAEQQELFCIGQFELEGTETFCFNNDSIKTLKIKSIIMSEGSTVMSDADLTPDDVVIFTNPLDQSWDKYKVWYKLLRILSGNKIKMESDNMEVDESLNCCIVEIDNSWTIILEHKSERIARKIGEIKLRKVHNNEIDLFSLTHDLFTNLSHLNVEMNTAMAKASEKATEAKRLRKERKKLDELIDIRDKKTKEILVGLLNAKKQKIVQLENYIRHHKMQPALPENQDDSEVINSNVKDEVTNLNSPGKRKTETKAPRQRGKMLRRIRNTSNNVDLKPPSSMKRKQEATSTDDFGFYGISKGDGKRQKVEDGSHSHISAKRDNETPIDDDLSESMSDNPFVEAPAASSTSGTQKESPVVLKMGTFKHHKYNGDVAIKTSSKASRKNIKPKLPTKNTKLPTANITLPTANTTLPTANTNDISLKTKTNSEDGMSPPSTVNDADDDDFSTTTEITDDEKPNSPINGTDGNSELEATVRATNISEDETIDESNDETDLDDEEETD